MNKQQRKVAARIRPQIIRSIVKLERKYGESLVTGAINRHQQIRRERRKLETQRSEIEAKIKKLSR